MKYVVSRERPSETNDPDSFFQGPSHQSFPSGEVAEIMPAYDAIARVKVHGHWQSDVLVGAGVGIAWGIHAHHRKTPLFLGELPGHGLMVGYAKQF